MLICFALLSGDGVHSIRSAVLGFLVKGPKTLNPYMRTATRFLSHYWPSGSWTVILPRYLSIEGIDGLWLHWLLLLLKCLLSSPQLAMCIFTWKYERCLDLGDWRSQPWLALSSPRSSIAVPPSTFVTPCSSSPRASLTACTLVSTLIHFSCPSSSGGKNG